MFRDLVSLAATRNLPLGVLMKSRTIRVVSPKDNLAKHGKRYLEVIRKNGNSAKTSLKTEVLETLS